MNMYGAYNICMKIYSWISTPALRKRPRIWQTSTVDYNWAFWMGLDPKLRARDPIFNTEVKSTLHEQLSSVDNNLLVIAPIEQWRSPMMCITHAWPRVAWPRGRTSLLTTVFESSRRALQPVSHWLCQSTKYVSNNSKWYIYIYT